MFKYPLLASRVFNTPLLCSQDLSDTAATIVMNGNVAEMAVKPSAPDAVAPSATIVNGVGIIPITGALTNKQTMMDAVCGTLNSYDALRSQIESFEANPNVKTILFDICSGGGEATGCFALATYIANEVSKPTFSYCNELTCSAAYAIASACDYVYASANASVGSIGVVMNLFNVTDNLKQQGVTVHTIQGGANKTIGSPFKPLSDSDLEYLQGVVNAMYEDFCSLVATNRGLPVQSIRNTEASVYTPVNAKAVGLIDGVRTLSELRDELGLQAATKPDAVIATTADNGKKLSGYSDVLAHLKANQDKYIIKV